MRIFIGIVLILGGVASLFSAKRELAKGQMRWFGLAAMSSAMGLVLGILYVTGAWIAPFPH